MLAAVNRLPAPLPGSDLPFLLRGVSRPLKSATILGIPTATVHTRLARGRAKSERSFGRLRTMNRQFEYQHDAWIPCTSPPEQKSAHCPSRPSGRPASRQSRTRRPVRRTVAHRRSWRYWSWQWAPPEPPASSSPPRKSFAPIFGGSAAQTEIIDKIGYPIGASDTDERRHHHRRRRHGRCLQRRHRLYHHPG